ncbi:MAG TPA: hypothetical protein VH257_11765, partial [Chloroflexota bacterium]|nr:hypothetical protein [Chloroflexota bacterium]
MAAEQETPEQAQPSTAGTVTAGAPDGAPDGAPSGGPYDLGALYDEAPGEEAIPRDDRDATET